MEDSEPHGVEDQTVPPDRGKKEESDSAEADITMVSNDVTSNENDLLHRREVEVVTQPLPSVRPKTRLLGASDAAEEIASTDATCNLSSVGPERRKSITETILNEKDTHKTNIPSDGTTNVEHQQCNMAAGDLKPSISAKANGSVSCPNDKKENSVPLVRKSSLTPLYQSSESFDIEDYCCFRLHMMNEYSQKVMYWVFLWGTKDKKHQEENLEDYLFREKKLPTKNAYKSIFNKTQRDKIKEDPSGGTYDITLLYICIQWGCEGLDNPKSPTSKWIHDLDSLEGTLTLLKQFRNDLKHGKFSTPKTEFFQQVEHLRGLLTKTLRLAGQLYSVDDTTIECRIRAMNEHINNIRDKPVAPTNHRLFVYLQTELKTSGKEEISDVYNQFSNFNPVSFLTGEQLHLNVGLIFTRIDVIDYEKRNLQEEAESQSIEYENLLQYGCPAQQRCNKIRLLEGPAGSGKTTLTRKMINDWVQEDSTMADLSSYDLLLCMECRDTAASTFAQLLESLMPETAKKFSKEDLVRCALSLKLLIFVDGIDELNKSSTALFKEILSLQKKHNITLFCTTRPEKVEDYYKMIPHGQETSHLKIIGITESRREEFAIKYHDEMKKIGRSKQDTEGLIEYLRTTGSRLRDHWRLPLNLVLLTILWALAPKKVNFVTTATELYFEIYILIVEKLLERLKGNEATHSLSVTDLRHKIEEFALRLFREALVELNKDEIILSDESRQRLEKICRSVDLPLDETFGAFLVKKIIWTVTGTLSKISYPHKGFQDFLGAIWILLKLKEKGVSLDTNGIIGNFPRPESPLSSSSKRKTSFQKFWQMFKPRNLTLRLSKWKSSCKSVKSTVKTLRQGVSLPNLLFGAKEPEQAITVILQELFGENETQIQYYKYNNVFVHLTGLLHMTSQGSIDASLVDELVSILRMSGIKKRDQWLDLLSNVKCDNAVASVIAKENPSVVQEKTTIEDIRVHSYVSLFQDKCPQIVNLNISARLQDIPRLEELLHLFCKHGCEVNELDFHHDFQRPERATDRMDDTLCELFQSCVLRTYRGIISDKLDPVLPNTLEKLRVGVVNLEQYARVHGLLSSGATRVPFLKRVVLHLSCGMDYSQLEPLPLQYNVHLYLSDVDSSSLEWAYETIKTLHGSSTRGFASIQLPRCKLQVSDFEQLVEELANARVHSKNLCTSANVPEESVQELNLLCTRKLSMGFWIMAEADIWKKW